VLANIDFRLEFARTFRERGHSGDANCRQTLAARSLTTRHFLSASTVVRAASASTGSLSENSQLEHFCIASEISSGPDALNAANHRVCDDFSRKHAANVFVSTMSPMSAGRLRRGI
jgi:hypothetical protein